MNHRGILFTILVILLAFSSSAQEPTESDLTVPSIPAGTSNGTEEPATPGDTSSEPTDTDRTYQLPEGLSPEAAFLARLSGLFRVEDPASLYSFEIRDREVEFFLDGTWESSLTGVLAINFSTDGDTISFSPPVFEQQVDLSTWLFLDQTWYFEATFAEEYTGIPLQPAMWAMTKPWSNMFGSVIRVSFFPIRIRLLRPAAATFSAPVSWEPLAAIPGKRTPWSDMIPP